MLPLAIVGLFSFAAIALATRILTRGLPRGVWIAVGVTTGVASVFALLVSIALHYVGRPAQQELRVTPELNAALARRGLPIAAQRAYEIDFRFGLDRHGLRVVAYQFPPEHADALVSALKRQKPGLIWTEAPAQKYTFIGARKYLPKEFLPTSDAWSVTIAFSPDARKEVAVDRSRGIFYDGLDEM